jgi:hypothetical protein
LKHAARRPEQISMSEEEKLAIQCIEEYEGDPGVFG